jgi:hypothetical protein
MGLFANQLVLKLILKLVLKLVQSQIKLGLNSFVYSKNSPMQTGKSRKAWPKKGRFLLSEEKK